MKGPPSWLFRRIVPLVLMLPLLPVHAAASGTKDGKKPYVAIILPSDYRVEDFPLGAKTFRLDSNVRPEEVERIQWSLDGVRSGHKGASAAFTFRIPAAHVVEACIMTNRVNHCARERLGPREETVQTRLRPITAWVSRLDRPDEPVTGLGAGDFTLTHHRESLDARIVSVTENSAIDSVGICLAYLFDMSGSMIRPDREQSVFVTREDGSHALAPAVRDRFDAFAGVMKGTYEPGAARPDKDQVMGAVFALGLISIGPLPASQADTLPGRLEKVLMREYLENPGSPIWSATALYENVSLTATLLNHAASCRDKKKAIALDSDLLQSTGLGGNVGDFNEKTLESVRKDYEEHDSDRLLAVLARKEALTVPVYAIDRKIKPYTEREEIQRQVFLREIVEPSGGDTYYLATGSAEETGTTMQGFFGHLLRHVANSYDLFWDPEGIADPEEVDVGMKSAGMRVTYSRPQSVWSDATFAEKVLLGRAGSFDQDWNYNNVKRMAAAMFIRKRIEEGRGATASRRTILGALERERSLSSPSMALVHELELALCSTAEENIKYDAPSTGAILDACRDLERVETVAQERLLDITALVPAEVRTRFCASAPPRGRESNVMRSSLCADH